MFLLCFAMFLLCLCYVFVMLFAMFCYVFAMLLLCFAISCVIRSAGYTLVVKESTEIRLRKFETTKQSKT